MRSPENIQKHELIGLRMKVVKAKNSRNLDISGKIVDETKKTLLVETNGIFKRLFKEQIVAEIALPKNKIRIEGSLLLGRPWERLKKKLN